MLTVFRSTYFRHLQDETTQTHTGSQSNVRCSLARKKPLSGFATTVNEHQKNSRALLSS